MPFIEIGNPKRKAVVSGFVRKEERAEIMNLVADVVI